MSTIVKLIAVAIASSLLNWAQDANIAPAGVPAQIVVTLGHHYGQPPPVLTKYDLKVNQGYQSLPVTNLIPLRGEHAGLELFLLVDHCSNCEPGSKFQELSQFIRSQPPTTSVGIAYVLNGQLQVALNPTTDRDRAIRALNTPEGSKPASPFNALAELLRTWPATCARGACRRVVLMVSNGINPAATDKLQDPTAEAALAAAQRAGVPIYFIYNPSADYLKTDPSEIYAGQVQLSHIADESGGEAYFLGFGPLPSLAPFLADLADHLANQYLLEFTANPAEAADGLVHVTVKTNNSAIEVMVPDKVYVPTAEAAPAASGR
jgi:hypothetical protein